MENSQVQTAAQPNNIENNKKPVPKTATLLSGWIANSMNGGHNRTIAYKKIMAGEKHFEYGVNLNMKLLTPKSPTYQNLKCTIYAYFVPNSRVWKNAEKYTAQKGGTTVEKITQIPNFGGHEIPIVQTLDGQVSTNLQNTTAWRDSYLACYYPRIADFYLLDIQTMQTKAISALPVRGRIAIYNDFERNKEYAPELTEYNGDTVSNAEWESYLSKNIFTDIEHMRAKRPNSYYTNYRTEIQGAELEILENGRQFGPNNTTVDASNSLAWLNFENELPELRAQAMNANANDWDIIAKLRGCRTALEGKVQLLGKRTFNLNYATVTQNTYNTSSEIADEYRVLGQQGAYSYTNINLPLYTGVEFIEEGYVHIIANVWAETVFEKGIDRNLLNITAMDEYRPDLKEQKLDVLYQDEISAYPFDNQKTVRGYKRKFSEYFKLPNCLAADMLTNNYLECFGGELGKTANDIKQVITQKTYQFFEIDDEQVSEGEYSDEGLNKEPWLDYTDILINKNQAIMNTVQEADDERNIYVAGNNQIFLVGTHYCKAELPIDEEIKNEIMEWSEH